MCVCVFRFSWLCFFFAQKIESMHSFRCCAVLLWALSACNTCNTRSYSRGMNFGMDVIIYVFSVYIHMQQNRKNNNNINGKMHRISGWVHKIICSDSTWEMQSTLYRHIRAQHYPSKQMFKKKSAEDTIQREKPEFQNNREKNIREIVRYVYREQKCRWWSRQFTWTQTAYIDCYLFKCDEKTKHTATASSGFTSYVWLDDSKHFNSRTISSVACLTHQ